MHLSLDLAKIPGVKANHEANIFDVIYSFRTCRKRSNAFSGYTDVTIK